MWKVVKKYLEQRGEGGVSNLPFYVAEIEPVLTIEDRQHGCSLLPTYVTFRCSCGWSDIVHRDTYVWCPNCNEEAEPDERLLED